METWEKVSAVGIFQARRKIRVRKNKFQNYRKIKKKRRKVVQNILLTLAILSAIVANKESESRISTITTGKGETDMTLAKAKLQMTRAQAQNLSADSYFYYAKVCFAGLFRVGKNMGAV